MNAGAMVGAMKRWLPYPVYRFVGGPFDGQDRAVDLFETDQGMIPPPMLQVADMPLIPDYPPPDQVMAECVTYTVHLYRFIPDRGSINQGQYEWVPQ